MSSISSATLAASMKLFESSLQAGQTAELVSMKVLETALDTQKQMAAELIKMLENVGQIIDIEA